MSNSVEHPLNDALFNMPLDDAEPEPEKIAVAADIKDETLIQMMLNKDFKFEETEAKSLPSSMFPCLEVDESSSIPIPLRTASPDLDNSNIDEDFQTPSKALVSVEALPESSQQRKRKRRRLDLVLSEDHEKRPDWLPPDWQVEYRLREGGASAGLTDRYYYEPVSRRQFRSKKEVLCYLETGTRRKCKGKSQEYKPSISSRPSEQKGSFSERKKRSGLNFDFSNPPKKVTWILNSFAEAPGSWTSFISGEIVPGRTREEWDAAFTYLIHGKVAAASTSKVDEVGVNLEAGA